MASFNSTPSAFPRQAVVASATLPPKAPAPSFFGGNTADANPSAPVVDPTPPADTFTATAPAPVATTAPDPADAKKAEAAKKENGFVKFAKSPWGIGAGVAAVLGGGLLIWKKPWQGGNTISQLEKVVKDLGIDDLDPEHKNNLLQKFAEHLQGLTANTTEHTPETWDKLSSAIVDVHAKHGDDFTAQSHLLKGLHASPQDLLGLNTSAHQAIYETSQKFIENLGTKKAEEGGAYLEQLGTATQWIFAPHGEAPFGIKNESDLLHNAIKTLDAIHQADPETNHFSAIHRSLSTFTLPKEHFSIAKKAESIPEVDVTQIVDPLSAGIILRMALESGNTAEIEKVFNHLKTKGLGVEGFGKLSQPDGFKDLEARLLPKPELPKTEPKERGFWNTLRFAFDMDWS